MRGLSDLILECAADAAETALFYAHWPDAELLIEEELARQRRDKDAAAKREARLLRRLRLEHREVRTCPICREPFVVMLHSVHGGRPKLYDRGRCKQKAWRQAQPKEEVDVAP